MICSPAANFLHAVLPKTSRRPTSVPAALPQPLHEIPLKAWRQHPALQAHLRKLLDDPVFLQASQTIRNYSFPGIEPAARAEPGVSADATNNAIALRYAHRAGIGYSFHLLRHLLVSTGPAPADAYGALHKESE